MDFREAAYQFESQGFKNAPVTKVACSVILIASFTASFILDPYFLSYDYEDIFVKLKFLRLFVSLHCFSRLSQAMFAVVIIFKFRQIERIYGSHQFLSLLCCQFVLSAVSMIILLHLYPRWRWDFGPVPVIFGFFVPYYNISSTEAFRFRFITNKSITYFLGLQIALHNSNATIGAILGLIIGVLVKKNVLWCKTWFPFVNKIPFSSDYRIFIDHSNFPATMEAQQIDLMERFQQQAVQRNFQLDESAVTQLVEMGFSREMAIEALQNNNNDIEGSIAFLVNRLNTG